MNKRDVATQLALQADLPRAVAVHITDCFIKVLHDALVSGKKVKLAGFGSLRVTTRKAHRGFDPSAGQHVVLPARKCVVFRPGQDFRRRLNHRHS